MDESGNSRRRFLFRSLAGGFSAALATVTGLISPAEAETEAAGAVLAKTKSIPVRGGKIVKVKSKRYVVTQPKKGVFRCFSAICTHQGCAVSSVTKTINCPCHGSKFSISNGGAVSGPAERPLARKKITVKKGVIRLA